jgi:hypothetical protein
MKYYKTLYTILEYLIIVSLSIVTVATGIVFIITLLFKDHSYQGFYSNWQFPMLLALFTDVIYFKYLKNSRGLE